MPDTLAIMPLITGYNMAWVWGGMA